MSETENQNVESVEQLVADGKDTQAESSIAATVVNDNDNDDYHVGQVRKQSNNVNSVAKRARLQDKKTDTWVCPYLIR